MDWLNEVPIGQYVAGKSGWFRSIDSRLKLTWVLMFLLTPVLSTLEWRVGLVLMLLILTFFSGLPVRTWLNSLCLLLILSGFVGALTMLLPTSEPSAAFSIRSPQELPNIIIDSYSHWEILRLGPIDFFGMSIGPLVFDRRSIELGIKTSTLIFTVIHSVNLMLITTAPEDLVWALSWFMAPLSLLGLPVDRLSFQLLLALRFLPLIQEEVQNLLRSLVTRAVDLKRLGFKASLGLLLSVGERLLANILLRAEQGADSLVARNGFWMSPEYFKAHKVSDLRSLSLNLLSALLLLLALLMRGKYGAL